MIWAILAMVGVPLWLCALGILALVFRNRALRHRYGDIPVRVLRPGKTRWVRGHAVWVSDVFAWRGSPAAWREDLAHVVSGTVRVAESADQKALHGLGDNAVVAALTTGDGRLLRVAAASECRTALMGPFVATAGKA